MASSFDRSAREVRLGAFNRDAWPPPVRVSSLEAVEHADEFVAVWTEAADLLADEVIGRVDGERRLVLLWDAIAIAKLPKGRRVRVVRLENVEPMEFSTTLEHAVSMTTWAETIFPDRADWLLDSLHLSFDDQVDFNGLREAIGLFLGGETT